MRNRNLSRRVAIERRLDRAATRTGRTITTLLKPATTRYLYILHYIIIVTFLFSLQYIPIAFNFTANGSGTYPVTRKYRFFLGAKEIHIQ
jgi:hypothetical protein